MKSIKYIKSIKKVSVALAAIYMLGSCNVNDPIYDTDHPDKGKIILTMDWSGMGAGITKPTSYSVKVNDFTVMLSGDCNTIDKLFDAGTYKGSAYNTADEIAMNGMVATVSAEGTGFIKTNPGWLFTAHEANVIIEKGKVHQYTATMQQQVRQLTLVLKPEGGTAGNITAISAEFSGVAASWDFSVNQPTGGPASVKPVFIKQTDGTWTATVRLLGVTGGQQELKTVLSFTGSTPADQTITSDLTTLLASFNALSDAKTPLTLSATVVETPTETEFTATINGWNPVNGSGMAN